MENITTEINESPFVPGKPKPYAILNIAVFVLILLSGGILSLVLPKQSISEIEKRKLATMPEFSWHYLFHGKYTSDIEMYYADNFPFRESFVSASHELHENLGYRDKDIGFYDLAKKGEEHKVALPSKHRLPATDSINKKEEDSLENDAEMVNSLFIYKGRAIQLFGGSKYHSGLYTDMINNYHKVLGKSVHIYCLTIPTANDFYLPKSYKLQSNNERNNIAYINSRLDTGITGVNAYTEISAHKDEYLYFYTDHHWTGRAAYYAYRAFCNAAGLEPYELKQFEKRIIPNFLGTLYSLTQDSRIKKHTDSVEYYRLPVTTKSELYKEDLKKHSPTNLLIEIARGANAYGVFLGGDFPLIHTETSVKNGKKILIIKDSYGNAFSPYLSLHYQDLYIIDYRYFSANIPDFVRKNKIDNILFLHNTFVANAKYTTQRESYLMRTQTLGPTLLNNSSK